MLKNFVPEACACFLHQKFTTVTFRYHSLNIHNMGNCSIESSAAKSQVNVGEFPSALKVKVRGREVNHREICYV